MNIKKDKTIKRPPIIGDKKFIRHEEQIKAIQVCMVGMLFIMMLNVAQLLVNLAGLK
jgi:hypothetical protein